MRVADPRIVPPHPASRARQFWRAYRASRLAVGSAVVLGFLLLAALWAPLLSPQDPHDLAQINIADSRQGPGAVSASTGQTFLLGTDEQGRDMRSAMLFGLRISLGIGTLATLVALALGVSLGLVAGYAGGRFDTLLMRAVDIQLSFPAILLALILIAVLKPGVSNVVIALVTVQWAYYARAVRSVALVERQKEYIDAARGLGLSHARIVFKHLLPNCLPPLIVVAALQIANAIALEATLSYLGLGVPVTEPSLGLLIANGQQYLLAGQYWISVFPGLLLLLTILSINLVADRLRDVLNPRHVRQGGRG